MRISACVALAMICVAGLIPSGWAAEPAAVQPTLPAQPAPLQPEWVLIRWIGPQRCEVLHSRPPFGRWEELGTYSNKKKAEQAMERQQQMRLCKPKPPLKPEAE